jgi:hypothetical protein
MENIIMTGYTEKQFAKKMMKQEKKGCYLCKRIDGDKSVVVAEDIKIGELGVRFFNVEIGPATVSFPLCHECMALVTGIGDMVAEGQRSKNLHVNLN